MNRYLPLIAAALGLWPAATLVQAQGCGVAGCAPVSPGCGPLVSACVHGRSDCGPCGLKQYPLMEKRYIRQFCRPTISPDSCFGYFRPQITPWSEACPNWSGPDIPHPGPYMFQRASASAPVQAEEPKQPVAPAPAAKPKEATPKEAMPMPMDPLPKPPSTPLPTPKDAKPVLPPPMPMDPLGKPPVLPMKPKEEVKPKDGRSAGLPEVPTVPSLPPLPSIPTSTQAPY